MTTSQKHRTLSAMDINALEGFGPNDNSPANIGRLMAMVGCEHAQPSKDSTVVEFRRVTDGCHFVTLQLIQNKISKCVLHDVLELDKTSKLAEYLLWMMPRWNVQVGDLRKSVLKDALFVSWCENCIGRPEEFRRDWLPDNDHRMGLVRFQILRRSADSPVELTASYESTTTDS